MMEIGHCARLSGLACTAKWRLVRVCRTSGRARLVEIVLAQAETPCTISWIMHKSSSLSLSGSTIATGDRSVGADNSSVWLTEGSSLSTYRISGSGSVTAEGGSALNVTQNVTVDGSVTVADSTLTAKSAAVSNGNLSVSGASTVTTESVSVTNGSLDISGETGQNVSLSALTGDTVEYRLGDA